MLPKAEGGAAIVHAAAKPDRHDLGRRGSLRGARGTGQP
jgi:hypothetical protein